MKTREIFGVRHEIVPDDPYAYIAGENVEKMESFSKLWNKALKK